MITYYRAMCEEEYTKTSPTSLSFLRRFKWLGTKEFVLSRVMDGSFNNSKHKRGKYEHLVSVSFDEKYLSRFDKVGNKELQLDRRKSNFPVVVQKIW